MKTLNKKNLKKINRMLTAYQVADALYNKNRKSEDKEKRAWASFQFRRSIIIGLELYKEFGIAVVSEKYFDELDEDYARYKLEAANNYWLDLFRQRKEQEKAVA